MTRTITASRRTILIFASGNFLALGISMLSSLLAARLLEPRLMGIYNALNLSVVLAPIVTLGVINGLNRQLPYMIGLGEHERIKEYANVAHFLSYWLAIGSVVIFLIAGAYKLSSGSVDWGWGIIFFGFVVAVSFLRNYIECTYRTGGEFERLTRVKVLCAVIGLVLVTTMLFSPWGGMLFRTLIVAVVGLMLLWRNRPVLSNPLWKQAPFYELVSIGMPIFIVGYLFSVFTSLDRLIIGSFLGVESLGRYTPATLVLQGMSVLPMSVNQVIYPRMATRFGETLQLTSLRDLAFKPLVALLAIQIPVVGLGWMILPKFVELLLPKYTAGIEAARWALVAGAILSLMTPTIIFNIARRQGPYAVIMITAMLFFCGLAMTFIKLGFDLVGITWALCLANVFFVAACSLAAERIIRS